MVVDLLAFGAHPDDVEIGIGATLLKHRLQGYTTAICDLTEAELSSNGTVERRKIESEEAGSILKINKRLNLGLPDRGLTRSSEQIDQITEVIRTYRPTVVFAPFWEDRHPDHRQCGKMVREAVFNAKLVQKKTGTKEPHHVQRLYFYYINGYGKVDVVVDVSDIYEEKIKALKAYRSQFVRSQVDIDTPINDPNFFDRIRGRDIQFGQLGGVAYGEGLVSLEPMVVSKLM